VSWRRGQDNSPVLTAFEARAIDVKVLQLEYALGSSHPARRHSFLEINRNCNVLNDVPFNTGYGVQSRVQFDPLPDWPRPEFLWRQSAILLQLYLPTKGGVSREPKWKGFGPGIAIN
jgi:hypothetical protein